MKPELRHLVPDEGRDSRERLLLYRVEANDSLIPHDLGAVDRASRHGETVTFFEDHFLAF